MTKNPEVLPYLERPVKDRTDGRVLWISHIDKEMFPVTRSGFVSLLIEAAYLYTKYLTMSAAFNFPSFFRFGEQLLKILYDPYVEFNDLSKPRFLEFIKKKLAEVLDEESWIQQLYLGNMEPFGYKSRNKKNQRRKRRRLDRSV